MTHTLPNIKHTPSVQAIGKHQRKMADDDMMRGGWIMNLRRWSYE